MRKSIVLGMRSNSQKRRHRGAAPSTCASRRKYARQRSHAVAVANSAGVRGHAEAPAYASFESTSALLAPRRTGAQPPSPLPSWTASNAFHSRRHGPGAKMSTYNVYSWLPALYPMLYP